MITLAQFLAGEPLAYLGFNGAAYTAQFQKRAAFPLPFVDIRDANGTLQKRPYMNEIEAGNFYAGIAADLTAHPDRGATP